MSGLFITFEGPDGCGKTTQLKRLQSVLEQQDIPVVATREPGGSWVGDRVRSILLDPSDQVLHPRAEVFLFLAGRAQNIEDIVRPALAKGEIVLSDRHRDSSSAFQGGGRELGVELIDHLNDIACVDVAPDCTLFFDIPVAVSLARAKTALQDQNTDGQGDRIEREALAFHERLYAAYQELIRKYPQRFLVIDGQGTIDTVSQRMFTALADRYPEKFSSLRP